MRSSGRSEVFVSWGCAEGNVFLHSTRFVSGSVADNDVKREVLFDVEHDRYQVLIVGWRGHGWFHSSIIHMDIIDGQIWIQYDVTESGIADDFVELGVPKEGVVLAFHAPCKQKFTGFRTRKLQALGSASDSGCAR